MFNEVKKSIKWGEETLTLETGKIARQADSTVIATYGETSVLAAVCFAKKEKEGQSFFPLTVNYQEKYYAAGKIPGGFFKREARPPSKPTRQLPIGPINGAPDKVNAADAAIIATISGSLTRSCDKTVNVILTSCLKPGINNGRIGRSIKRAVNVSFSVGRASLLKKPPGILPAA